MKLNFEEGINYKGECGNCGGEAILFSELEQDQVYIYCNECGVGVVLYVKREDLSQKKLGEFDEDRVQGER